jgi:hypothetical protein
MRETVYLHPLDAALVDLKLPASGLDFPPVGWSVMRECGLNGYALQDATGLRLIVDCARKDDDRFWLHVSVSRAKALPTHLDMRRVKDSFIGDRYAYAVLPPRSEYVNIHPNCLHLWALVDDSAGRVLPEFSGDIDGVKNI